MKTAFFLTKPQERELNRIAEQGIIRVKELTPAQQRVFEVLRNMRLVTLSEGVYGYREQKRMSTLEIDKYVRKHHRTMDREKIAAALAISMSTLSKSFRRLGIEGKPGRKVKRICEPALTEDQKETLLVRPRADHDNKPREYYVEKYLNAEIKANFNYR